jgi:hypothetical protein
MPSPTTRQQPRSHFRADVDEELARLRREQRELKESTKVLHSVILALVEENQRLTRRRRLGENGDAQLSTPNKPSRSMR